MPTSVSLSRQRGAVLIVGLIFLIMLTLLGVAAYMAATMEERMAGNELDRIRSFEAAEASARDCESVLAGFGTLPSFNGTNGMYTALAATQAQYSDKTSDDDWWKTAANVRVLVPSLPGVALQPRCIIETMPDIEVKSEQLGDPQAKERRAAFRITAVGYGANASASAQIQTTYSR